MPELLVPSEPDSAPPVSRLEFRGGIKEVWACREQEVILVGRRGTGKSTGICWLLRTLCDYYPGIRVLMAHRYRAKLTETILPIWHEILGKGHPAMVGSATPERRSHYTWPDWEDGRPGAHVVLAGVEEQGELLSAQYDVAVVFQVELIAEPTWGAVSASCRAGVLPWNQAIGDANPSFKGHWIEKRATRKACALYWSHFEDNPRAFERAGDGSLHITNWGRQYNTRLDKLPPGAQRERWRHGKFASEANAIFPEFDPEIHEDVPRPAKDSIVRWVGSIDWAPRGVGVMHIWGVDAKRRIFCFAEVYRRNQLLSWWCDQAAALWDEYRMPAVVADSGDLYACEVMNDRLMQIAGGAFGRIVHPTDKSVEWNVGVDLVRTALAEGRLFWTQGCLHGTDASLEDEGRPTHTTQEFAGYTWADIDPGKPIAESHVQKADRSKPHDGIDSTRYMMVFLHGRELPRSARAGEASAPAGLTDELIVPVAGGGWRSISVPRRTPDDDEEEDGVWR